MNKAAVKSASSTTAARMRSGAHYLAAIKDDGRHVYYDGELVPRRDFPSGFQGRGALGWPALFDIAADSANAETMTFPSPQDRQTRVAAAIRFRRPRPIWAQGA